MIYLTLPTEALIATVPTAQSTGPVIITTHWSRTTTEITDFDSKSVVIADNTPTVIVPAIPIQFKKAINYVSIYNTDSITRIVNIAKIDGVTPYLLRSFQLAPNESAEYNDKKGWVVFSSNGAIKNIYQNGVSPIGSNVQMVTIPAGPGVVNNNAVANTIQDITGLQFAVIAGNRYRFKFVINYSAQALTTGSRWAVNGPGSPSDLNYDSDYSLTVTTRSVNTGQSAYDLPAASNATSPSLTNNIAIIEGFITPSANGVVIGRFASEVAGSAITVKPGSYLEYQQL